MRDYDDTVTMGYYKKLVNLRERFEEQGVVPSDVFGGYKGCHFPQGPERPRILFVGKATYSWEAPKRGAAGEFVYDSLLGGVPDTAYWSQFWSFIVDLTARIYSSLGHSVPDTDIRRWALERIAWSNVMKIGVEPVPGAGNNPSGKLYKWQEKICRLILKQEFQCLRPTCAVFVTGNEYGRFMTGPFGGDQNWDKPTTDLWAKTMPAIYGAGRLYWTRHPQGWKIDLREQAKNWIIKDHEKNLKQIRDL